MLWAHEFIRAAFRRCCWRCYCTDEDTPGRDDGLEVKQSGGLRSTAQLRLSSWAHVEVQVLVVDLSPLFRGQKQLAQVYSLGCMKPSSAVHRFSEVRVVAIAVHVSSACCGEDGDLTQRLCAVQTLRDAQPEATNTRARSGIVSVTELHAPWIVWSFAYTCSLIVMMTRQIHACADGREGLATSRNSGEQARRDGCACCGASSSAFG